MTENIAKFTKKILTFAENLQLNPLSYVLIFLCISFTRNMLEGAFEYTHTVGTSEIDSNSVHQLLVLFNLEWITLLCAIAAAISVISRIKITTLLNLVLFCYIWIISVPFLDLIIYQGRGCRINYLYTLKEYVSALAFFFVPWKDVRVCAGIRIEVFAASMFAFIYIRHKTSSLAKAILSSASLYVLAVSSMAYPVFIMLPSYLISSKGDFVNQIFFEPSLIQDGLHRVSVMIFILLVPVLFLIHRLHYGALKNIALFKNLFSPVALLYAAVFTAGFINNTSNYIIFSNIFDFFTLAACILIILLLTCFSSGSSLEKNLLFILPLLSAICGLAISFHFTLAVLFVFSVSYLLKSPAYSQFAADKAVPFNEIFTFIAVYFAGLSCIFGAFALKEADYIMLPLLVFMLALIRFFGIIKNETASKYLSIPVFLAYCAFAPATGFVNSFFPAVIAGIVSCAVFYSGLNRAKKTSSLTLILAVFILAVAVSV